MLSSSRSTRLKPSCPPSVVATLLATGMNAGVAGILSSARLRFANPYGPLPLFLELFRLLCLLELAHGGRFQLLSLIHISEPTRLGMISYAVFCLKKKKQKTNQTPLT